MDNLYGDGPDGYCGDEDNGQTSAWFVFSAMGFYPVAPVTGQYVIGSPLFEYIKIELNNNKSVIINVSNNEKENVYLSSVKLNNRNYNKNWLDHSIFVTGGEIDFIMSSIPNYSWGSDKESVPYSMSLEKK